MRYKFAVTAMGRSGTMWISEVLDRNQSMKVLHEPCSPADWAQTMMGTLDVEAYLETRAVELQKCIDRFDRPIAEVNSYLRYCIREVAARFDIPVVAVIRDGRYVVRSMLARGVFAKLDKEPWSQMLELTDVPHDRISLCAWYWAHTYRNFLEWSIPIFRLRQLNEDFDYFRRFCRLIGVQVSREEWEGFAGKRVNVWHTQTTPPRWRRDQLELFWSAAGDIQGVFYEDLQLL